MRDVCPVCCGSRVTPTSVLHDDRFAAPGTVELATCADCSHRFLADDATEIDLAGLYSKHYPRGTFRVEDYRPHHRVGGILGWLAGERRHAYLWVPPYSRILDVGCGIGQSLGFHHARGCDAYGVEADENVRAIAEAHGLDIRIGPFDASAFEPESFDHVTFDQVLEHMPSPIASLRRAHELLRPEGTVIVSTPNVGGLGARLFGPKWIHWHVPYHRQFFTPRSLDFAAGRAGFRVERMVVITSSEWLAYQLLHIGMYPAPGQPSPFWAPQRAARTTKEKVVARLVGALQKARIPDVVTRALDALGMGDNLVAVLRKTPDVD